jgi:hydrogenase nickel incorporation protein HypA/HybF
VHKVHELAITQSIVEAVADRVPDGEVVCVRLAIGKLSGVAVESVRFCFDLVAEGTRLDGAELRIEQPGGRMRCRRCGGEFDSDDLLAVCPCGGVDLEVIGGQELLIRAVEVRAHV